LGVGEVQDGDGAKRWIVAARLGDKLGHLVERPDVKRARQERDDRDRPVTGPPPD
jgi:hypothetical protein